jgi:hypothetical protein
MDEVLVSDTLQSVKHSNQIIMRVLLVTSAIALFGCIVLGILFYNYVRSGHGVSCQTNALVRGMATDVDSLLKQVNTHASHVKFPSAAVPVPKACQ